jgi:hypothetical protein
MVRAGVVNHPEEWSFVAIMKYKIPGRGIFTRD